MGAVARGCVRHESHVTLVISEVARGLRAGGSVNLEIDLVARYVARRDGAGLYIPSVAEIVRDFAKRFLRMTGDSWSAISSRVNPSRCAALITLRTVTVPASAAWKTPSPN